MRNFGWLPVVGVILLAACGDSGNGGDVTEPTPNPENVAPTANFGVSCELLVCTFSDSSSDSDGSVKAWQWDFGDGATASEQNPVHTYAAAQSYTTTLVVTDSAGATGTVSKTATPEAPPPPTAELTCTDAAGPGASASCSITLPVTAGVRAVLGAPKPCGAVGDVLAFSAPVADTLSSDACFAPAGTQAELAPSPAGTVVTFEMRGGLTLYSTAVHLAGTYPEWTINVEDALGAPFDLVPDFADLVVTLTVVP